MWYETLIRQVLWGLLFTGIWFMFYEDFIRLFKEKFLSKRAKIEKKRAGPFISKIQQLLGIAFGQSSIGAAYRFIAILVSVSIITFTTLHASGASLNELLLWTLGTPVLIFAFVLYRIRAMQVKTSNEGKYMIDELLNNYRIHHKNISEAVDQTVIGLKNYPHVKSLMANVALEMKDYRNAEELREVVNRINYKINTKWAVLLSNLIYAAVYEGDDITEGLIDLSKDLAELDQVNEKNRQINLEGTIMICWFIPGIIIGGLIMILKYADFTLAKYIEYQFLNEIGFRMFFYSLIAVAISGLTFLNFRNEKNDF
ncbi:hypothetical protein AWH48_16805 [Domibacillus aminovorans]|uniref:Type II secretion system protein GspF domain-containing protein n=1 Tax=Domibacillus aminovorans TaxID=29332 RepID=A0A177KZU4_9BACI|nr:hypothetical protein [Domibacillus aminovorans]OAH58657.1 hypothetical protein AWH48_16805 [Domibacillus aminovorans]